MLNPQHQGQPAAWDGAMTRAGRGHRSPEQSLSAGDTGTMSPAAELLSRHLPYQVPALGAEFVLCSADLSGCFEDVF